ncbi:hypothetical protein JTB14_031385 [Gonioctena quinquepunctata]|nr:hypothetical protein JTB14_031385 [Gonioctena quinquepunctata]
MSSSSLISLRALKPLFIYYKSQYSLASEILDTDIFVVHSCNFLHKADSEKQELISLLETAGLELRKISRGSCRFAISSLQCNPTPVEFDSDYNIGIAMEYSSLCVHL